MEVDTVEEPKTPMQLDLKEEQKKSSLIVLGDGDLLEEETPKSPFEKK